MTRALLVAAIGALVATQPVAAAQLRMMCAASTVTTADLTGQRIGGVNDSYWWLIDFDAKRISLCPPPAHNCFDASSFGWNYSTVPTDAVTLSRLSNGSPSTIVLDFSQLTMTMTRRAAFNGKPATAHFSAHCANAW